MTPAGSGLAAVRSWLESADFDPEPVVEVDGPSLVLDLGRDSLELGEPLDNLDATRLGELIDAKMREAGVTHAYGRWGEERALYRSAHFTGNGEPRTVHLGMDLFCRAGTPVKAPLDAVVEIVANNARELDYGPVVILKHWAPAGQPFWTLCGHLGEGCLKTLRAGMPVGAGEVIARVGTPPVNGNWPPHLHFQVILDLKGLGREFPGVAAAGEAQRWFELSPSPAPFFPELTARELDGRARRD